MGIGWANPDRGGNLEIREGLVIAERGLGKVDVQGTKKVSQCQLITISTSWLTATIKLHAAHVAMTSHSPSVLRLTANTSGVSAVTSWDCVLGKAVPNVYGGLQVPGGY